MGRVPRSGGGAAISSLTFGAIIRPSPDEYCAKAVGVRHLLSSSSQWFVGVVD